MATDNSALDIVTMGRSESGDRDLVLLHSLLSDRTAFDRIGPWLALERRLWPGAKLVELPDCGHSPHTQDAQGFWQAIKPFLDLGG